MYPQTLHISTLGLGETEIKVLQVAVVMLKDDDIACELNEDSKTSSEIIVIDMDNESSKKTYPTLRESQVKIILSAENNFSGKNIVSMRKPVRVTALKDVLLKICQQINIYLTRQKTTTQNSNNSTNASLLSGTKSKNFFQHMYTARHEGMCLKIGCPEKNAIYVHGKNRTIYSAGDHNTITEYFTVDQGSITASTVQESELISATANLSPHALDAELWQAGVVCSHGQLLPGHRTDTPVKLKAWPNFSRQGFKPDFFKIAAIMAKRPISIDNISKAAQIQLDVVIDFYNAAFAVDLIEVETNQNLPTKQERQLSNDRKTLLGKLAQRLKLA